MMALTCALTRSMIRLLCACTLLVGAGLCSQAPKQLATLELAQRQHDVMLFFYHIYEPIHVKSCESISKNWKLEKNIGHFKNVTAVTTLIEMLDHDWKLPKAVPFSIYDPTHRFEVVTVFNVLFSAEDFDTFYQAAAFLRDRINEGIFSYALSIVILNRPDTQGIIIPPVYEYLCSNFNNGEVMNTAQRINVHGDHMLDYYPTTFKLNKEYIIRWNDTAWPYHNNRNGLLTYYTEDYGLNALYYYLHLISPFWLGGDIVPLVKDNRGEIFWFLHKQFLTRYYMERLSNGLGEIPELGDNIVQDGYSSGLVYYNGIPYPARPKYFHLDQPDFVNELQKISDYEGRVRAAIEIGYLVDNAGNHIDLRTPESIDILGRLIEANVDSPNPEYYKDFISIWKHLLGNSFTADHNKYYHNFVPLVVPSVLDNFQTAMRDPAFYMIWKRVLGLFQLWQQHLPPYKREELSLSSVAIEKVEVDKMVTYIEHNYMNITSALHMNEEESQLVNDDVSVLVQYPRLNHKRFQVRITVKSEVAKKIVVKFFLAPKHDSYGSEIPLETNSQNFFLLDRFIYDLPEGESVIVRDSNDNALSTKDWTTASSVYISVNSATHDNGHFFIDPSESIEKIPKRLLIPKGHVNGMPFILAVHISEYHAPKMPYSTGFDPVFSMGIGSGARRQTSDPLGFPFNRPVSQWQVEGLKNMMFQDILIYHKHQY